MKQQQLGFDAIKDTDADAGKHQQSSSNLFLRRNTNAARETSYYASATRFLEPMSMMPMISNDIHDLTFSMATFSMTTTTDISGGTPCGDGNVGNGICRNEGDCCSQYGWCGKTDSDGHCKHDINYVREQVTKLIQDSERELIPKFLRLGFHDCVGGCDGCIDMTNPDNQGLQEPIDAIYPIVDKFKASYSRADIWAMATLVSADLAVVDGRPHGYHFLMRYIGRHDCSGADAKGVGGPDITMPTNDLTTHELLAFFAKNFEFDLAETVTVMGVHAVAVAHRENVGFGNIGKEDGWVYKADDYELNNRYYDMLVGDDMSWQIELVHNEGDIPSRYQWFQEKKGETERPIMTNTDMGLARDLSAYMNVDEDGNTGAVSCVFKSEEEETNNESGSDSGSGGYMRERTLKSKPDVCPVAHDTVEMMLKYREDNELFLIDFEHVLEKMLKSGYHGEERKLTRIIH